MPSLKFRVGILLPIAAMLLGCNALAPVIGDAPPPLGHQARLNEWEFNPESQAVGDMCTENSPVCGGLWLAMEENGNWSATADTRWMDGGEGGVYVFGTAEINRNWGGYTTFKTLFCTDWAKVCADNGEVQANCGFQANALRAQTSHKARRLWTPYSTTLNRTAFCPVTMYNPNGGGGGPDCDDSSGVWQQYFWYEDGVAV